MDVADVHKGLAEQAFRNNVQQVLADGNMTKEKSEYLKDAQKQLGLPDDAAKVIIRGIMNSKLMGNVQAQVSQGKMTMAEVRNLASQDVDMESMVRRPRPSLSLPAGQYLLLFLIPPQTPAFTLFFFVVCCVRARPRVLQRDAPEEQ